ncbi:MAG: DUF3084 domain-containing protein [Chroococcales cyanobacterium]
MTSAYVLIAAILILGGLLAALGDRLGSKIGKARLRLFKLRPRQTAVVVTILTGTTISASTLGILFATSKSLRQGVFQLDEILKKRREAIAELAQVKQEKTQVEQELKTAKAQQTAALRRLDQINANFQQAQTQLKSVTQQALTLRSEVESLLAERQDLFEQREQLKQQIARFQAQTTQLRAQIGQLEEQTVQLRSQVKQRDQQLERRDQTIAQRERLIAQKDRTLEERETRLQQLEQQQKVLQTTISERDQQIEQLDQQIAQRDQVLQVREARLEDLQKETSFLQREVALLEQYYQNYQVLRQGSVALVRGQRLAFGVVRIMDSSAAREAVEQLLRQANLAAIEATHRGNNNGQVTERVVQISQAQVDQLIGQISDGRDYVVRILSAGNYVEGEPQVRVFADVALNEEVFQAGEVLAAVSIDPTTMTQQEIQEQLDLLLAASRFRAIRAGILGDIQIEDGRTLTLVRFLDQLNASDIPLEQIRAIASESTSTAGPLKIQLVAMQDGKVIFAS